MSLNCTKVVKPRTFDHIRAKDAPFYVKSDGQIWNAYMTLNEEGEIGLFTAPRWENAVPEAIWHGRTKCWYFPSAVKGSAFADLMEDGYTQCLIRRIQAGLEIRWDGNNLMGSLTPDAGEASDELQCLLDELEGDCWALMGADCYISDCDLLDVWPAGKSLEEAALDIMADARENDFFCGDLKEVEDALLWKLQSTIDQDEDYPITAEQQAMLD